MDPLEDVLSVTGARAEGASTLTGHGDWALRFPAPAGAKFNSVTSGSCTVRTDEMIEPVGLRAGDAFLVTRPQKFVIATSPHAPEQSASPLFRASRSRTVEVGMPDAPVTTTLIGGSFTFDRRARGLLLNALPPLIYLPAHAPAAASAQHLLRRIDDEAQGGRLAAGVVMERLAVVLLIDMIRFHLSQHPEGASWLKGLTDPIVAAALTAIHTDPAEKWTVQRLAEHAHVARSTLAARFKTIVGQGPLEYLTRWRLEIGAHQLETTNRTIATIASDVGYGSEAAFALAFKRQFGIAPGRHRRRECLVFGVSGSAC